LGLSGSIDLARGRAMRADAIFRIYSMTKPITAVALLMLLEQGKVALDDPVHRYIPGFENLRVTAGGNLADGFVTEPSPRPMKIVDLMRHTSGLTYGVAGLNKVKQSYVDMKVMDANQTNEQMAEKLSKLALLYQPGTHWEYSMSTDVLGRVVEVASGMTPRQVHRGTNHQAAAHGRHRLRSLARQEGSRRQAAEGGAEERGAGHPRHHLEDDMEVGRRRHGVDGC